MTAATGPTTTAKRFVATTAAVGVVTGVVMVLMGMEPRLVLVGFLVVLVGAVSWLTFDLALVAMPLRWYDYGPGRTTTARPDRRVQALASRLRQPTRRRSTARPIVESVEPLDEIAETLLSVLDDHLLAECGIDRTLDPDAAAEALGPELAQFAAEPSARRAMTRRRALPHTVTAIEALTDTRRTDTLRSVTPGTDIKDRP